MTAPDRARLLALLRDPDAAVRAQGREILRSLKAAHPALLRGADLCGADLCGADLSGMDLRRARLLPPWRPPTRWMSSQLALGLGLLGLGLSLRAPTLLAGLLAAAAPLAVGQAAAWLPGVVRGALGRRRQQRDAVAALKAATRWDPRTRWP